MLKLVVHRLGYHCALRVLKLEDICELQQKISKCRMTSKWRFLKTEPNPSAFTLPVWCLELVSSQLLIFQDGLLVQSSRFTDNQCCVTSHNSKGLKHNAAEDCNLTTQPSVENCKYKRLMFVILPVYIITCVTEFLHFTLK